MKKWTLMAAVLVVGALVATAACAQETNLGDAKAAWWAKQATEFFKAQGKDKALAAFNDAHGQFARDDVSLYVLSADGKMLATPKGEAAGKAFLALQENGKALAPEIVTRSQKQPSGWLHYQGVNPATGKAEPVSLYYDAVDGVIIVGVAPGI